MNIQKPPKWSSWNISTHLPAFRPYSQKKESPLDLDHAPETETPGVMGLCTGLCFRVQKYKEAGLGPNSFVLEMLF
jgi:hypothetical protein